MMPKSTAPIDSRLADLSCAYRTVIENSKASGIMIATMLAEARSPRKMNRIAITSPMPIRRLCRTLCVVTWTSSVRWLNSLIFIPGGSSFRFWMSRILSSTAFDTSSDFSYFRMSTMPWTTSSSDFPFRSRPMMPSRG